MSCYPPSEACAPTVTTVAHAAHQALAYTGGHSVSLLLIGLVFLVVGIACFVGAKRTGRI